MDQTRAINALAPFIALAKSANSPRVAADLITKATSAPNTYVFAELLYQPNIAALEGHEQYGAYLNLLKCFAWGTLEDAKNMQIPPMSDAQAIKLRLLSLMTIASEQVSPPAAKSKLSYSSLVSRLNLDSAIDLEHLVTQAIYSNLITATLDPANQIVVVTSVAPLRDLAPGSVQSMIAELEHWSSRCTSVLGHLESVIASVKAEAALRHAQEVKTKEQVKAATERHEKNTSGALEVSRGGFNVRSAASGKKLANEFDDDDAMDVDSTGHAATSGGRKKSRGSGMSGMFGRMKSGRG